MTAFRPCAIVPTYHHVSALGDILDRLRDIGLHVIVVDDGNDAETAVRVAAICEVREGVELERHVVNAGKGAAVFTALELAARRGFTHALQVDADGQHDITRAAELVDLARRQPDALVTAKPIFDHTVPRVRLFARWITHIWVSINTLSFSIVDSMCGFRVYPIAATLAVASEANVAKRMGFDTEILVRLRWVGTPLAVLPVRVIYPAGNHSNFKAWDNVEVSRMHAKLFFLMLGRLPALIGGRGDGRHKTSRPTSHHWAALAERGSSLGLWILATIFRLFGRRVCLAIMSPVVLFFFLTGVEQRRASMTYLDRARRAGLLPARPGWFLSFRHFMAFGGAALDKFAAWTGSIPASDVQEDDTGEFEASKNSGQGALVLTAHLGNPEVIRAIASLTNRARVNVLVHTAHAVRFNALISAFSKSSSVRMIQVTEIGPDTAILLQAAIENGEWIVMVGDRVPVTGNGRISWAPFLGEPAPFAQGPYILGAILKCPVYLLFCLRTSKKFQIYFEPFAKQIDLPRGDRNKAIARYVSRYAARLEYYVGLAPLQWFNFFDYWHPAGMQPPPVALEFVERELVS